jgi:hypothetical protein
MTMAEKGVYFYLYFIFLPFGLTFAPLLTSFREALKEGLKEGGQRFNLLLLW